MVDSFLYLNETDYIYDKDGLVHHSNKLCFVLTNIKKRKWLEDIVDCGIFVFQDNISPEIIAEYDFLKFFRIDRKIFIWMIENNIKFSLYCKLYKYGYHLWINFKNFNDLLLFKLTWC